MKLCNVLISDNTCAECLDVQMDNRFLRPCDDCEKRYKDYELYDIRFTLLGAPYAIVISDGFAEKVKLERVYNIREVLDGTQL